MKRLIWPPELTDILLHVVLSGILALFVLTLFCFFYDNLPVHYPCEDGATDYRWETDRFYSQATEGIALGRTNNEGYLNLYDYADGDSVDILVMGSSHMEGFDVPEKDTVASRLNSLFTDRTVYNIGVSGHSFLVCGNNLSAALEKYRPGLAILEINNLWFAPDGLSAAVEGTLPELSSFSGGMIGLLQKEPFLRCLYHQLQNTVKKDDPEEQAADPGKSGFYPDLLDEFLGGIARTAEENDAAVLILYHPHTAVQSDGTLTLADDYADAAVFAQLCEAHGIGFLDMGPRFLREYGESHTVPYGFCITSVSSGHLNRQGHSMAAEELYRVISEQYPSDGEVA